MTNCEICGREVKEPAACITVEREGNKLVLEPVCMDCVDAILEPVAPWTGTGSLIPPKGSV